MSLHAVLLSIGLSGWREYLNDTRKALLQIVSTFGHSRSQLAIFN